MKTKTPTNLHEAVVAIGVLQETAKWTEGQLNLLLGFVTDSQDNKKAFEKYVYFIANESNLSEDDLAKYFARKFYQQALSSHYKSDESPQAEPQKTDSSPEKPSHESNVIQFPKFPPDN